MTEIDANHIWYYVVGNRLLVLGFGGEGKITLSLLFQLKLFNTSEEWMLHFKKFDKIHQFVSKVENQEQKQAFTKETSSEVRFCLIVEVLDFTHLLPNQAEVPIFNLWLLADR